MKESSTGSLMQSIIADLGLHLDERQFMKLVAYSELLWQGLSWLRIVGEKSIESLIRKQIYDSLFLLTKMEFKPCSRIVDLGSGGGLPGVPLAICREDHRFCLLDANRRKVSFMEEILKVLRLKNVEVICGRAEYFGRKAYGTIWGVTLAVVNLGNMAGIVVTGFLADHFGGYREAFCVILALTCLSAVLLGLVRRPRQLADSAR